MAATALSAPASLQLAIAKSKERLRLNAIKILHFDSRDTIVINEAFLQIQSFISGLHLTYGLTTSDIMAALQAAHQASDEYFTMRHTEAWDTTVIISQADIDADMQLFQDLNYDFTSMCRYKQRKLASNRISPARIQSIFGNNGTKIPGVDPRDIAILLDFAANGITPPVAPSFRPIHQIATCHQQIIIQAVYRWNYDNDVAAVGSTNTWYTFQPSASCRF